MKVKIRVCSNKTASLSVKDHKFQCMLDLNRMWFFHTIWQARFFKTLNNSVMVSFSVFCSEAFATFVNIFKW